MDPASEQARRRWYKRPSRIIPVVFAMALAIAVPVAWASFIDVPPSNPFYNDINAIQGAGVTQGCGGGNFCPTDNIQRQAEAAFLHRAMPRTAQSTTVADSTIAASGSFSTDTLVGQVTINVGGVSGWTQFVKADAHMTNTYNSGTAPFFVAYYLAEGACTGVYSPIEAEWIENPGFVTASISATKAVSTNTAHTFSLCAFTGGSNVADVNGGFAIQATTYPFGSTGGSTLGIGSTESKPAHHP
jgi:hypothetical protein